jgi:2-hydroxy-6-oxonona-2,4-dienedioate hydrolase
MSGMNDDDPIARLDAAAGHARTRCETGDVVWRIWGTGVPTLLLHGGHGSWMHWVRNLDSLMAQGRQLFVPDMPGYGESAGLSLPAEPGEMGDAIARPLSEGLETLLGARSCDVVGFSFGGIVGGFLTARRPERVRRLVLVGSGGLGLMHEQPLPLRSWRRLADPGERDAAHRFNLQTLMIHDPAAVDALAVRVQRLNAEAAGFTESRILAGSDALAQLLEAVRPSLAGIWGEHDATVRGRLDAVEARLRRIRSDAGWHVVEGAGHWAQYEQPRRFEAALVRALA